uniref:Uncharacterized protein n=1 Tax=Chenopodium quinoa TaxID=63459 RepID=A0A803L9J7_CHEQI
MEHQHGSEISDENIKGDDKHSTTEERISTSSVSSASDIKSAMTDFSFDDTFHIDKLGKGSFAVDSEQSDAAPQTTASSDDTSTLECPPVQVMERPAETSGYRIPSYVFATTKSSHPEWSTTSNESLFSIHTGNMSFTRDQFSWLLKSGELGIYGGPSDIRKSGELPPPSPVHMPMPMPRLGDQRVMDLHKEERTPCSSQETINSGEGSIQTHKKTSSSISIPSTDRRTSSCQMSENDYSQGTCSSQMSDNGDYTATSPSQMSEQTDSRATSPSQMSDNNDDSEVARKKHDQIVDIKDNVSSVSASASDDVPLTTCISHHSDTSGQSFAFPVLADIGRDKSVNSGQSHARNDLRKNTSTADQEATKPPNTTAAAEVAPPSNYTWLSSCFSCCSRCKEA